MEVDGSLSLMRALKVRIQCRSGEYKSNSVLGRWRQFEKVRQRIRFQNVEARYFERSLS